MSKPKIEISRYDEVVIIHDLSLIEMRDIRPIVVLTNNIDKLLILRAFFEGLIRRERLAFNVFYKLANEVAPIAFCIAFDVRHIGGNVCGEAYPRRKDKAARSHNGL